MRNPEEDIHEDEPGEENFPIDLYYLVNGSDCGIRKRLFWFFTSKKKRQIRGLKETNRELKSQRDEAVSAVKRAQEGFERTRGKDVQELKIEYERRISRIMTAYSARTVHFRELMDKLTDAYSEALLNLATGHNEIRAGLSFKKGLVSALKTQKEINSSLLQHVGNLESQLIDAELMRRTALEGRERIASLPIAVYAYGKPVVQTKRFRRRVAKAGIDEKSVVNMLSSNEDLIDAMHSKKEYTTIIGNYRLTFDPFYAGKGIYPKAVFVSVWPEQEGFRVRKFIKEYIRSIKESLAPRLEGSPGINRLKYATQNN